MKIPQNLTEDEKNYISRSNYLIRFAKLKSSLIENIGSHQKATLLELGCRTGMLTKFLKANGLININCCGIDVNIDFVNKANDNEMTARICDLNWEKIPYENEVFDIVTSFEVIEHIPFYHNHLSETNRVLKIGGILLLTTPNIANVRNRLNFIFGKDNHNIYTIGQSDVHYRMFTSNSIKKLLNMHHFNIDRCTCLAGNNNKTITSLLKKLFPSFGDIVFCQASKISHNNED